MLNQIEYESSFTDNGSVNTIDYYQLFIWEVDDSKVVFEEELLLLDGAGEQIDEVTVAVEKSGEDMLTVYQYSQDESHLLRVKSKVYRTLETATELRRMRQQDIVKTLRVTDSVQEYRVFLLCVAGKEGWRRKYEYTKSSNDLLFLEGSNIVLLRKLAVTSLSGHFRGQTINHEGELCDCDYYVERKDEDKVVVRRVVTASERVEVMITVLTNEGNILFHQWSSSEWYLVTGKQKNINVCRPTQDRNLTSSEKEQSSSEEEVNVDKDAYFSKKDEIIYIMKSYIRDQPDIQDMIADFLKNLLFEKPEDVIEFADNFFSEFIGVERQPSLNDLRPRTIAENTIDHDASSTKQPI